MKGIYWRSSMVSRAVLAVIAILALAALMSVELIKIEKKRPYYREKLAAARKMEQAMDVLKGYRIRQIGPLNMENDPAQSGLIGLPESPITTTVGYLPAKQTTINPNWAAALVDLLKKAGAKKGDCVAMGFSGSFPALNLAAIIAAEELNLKIVIISGVSASTWGANNPKFTWLDMERVLFNKKIIGSQSVAASFGGTKGTGESLSAEARSMLLKAIKRNQIRLIDSETIKESIDEHMAIFDEFAGGEKISVYVNVGGSLVSAGPRKSKKSYQPGLNRRFSASLLKVDSVMSRFARDGVPIIHMISVNTLANKYGLPQSPEIVPEPGEGPLFVKKTYNLYLVAADLLILIFLLYIFLKSDLGYRLFASSRFHKQPEPPEPMV